MQSVNILCNNSFPCIYVCSNLMNYSLSSLLLLNDIKRVIDIIEKMKESLPMSFPWLKTHILDTTTLNTFLSFYANFTNGDRGRKGTVASRPIHLTGFALVFLPALHSFLRCSVQRLAQRERRKK